MDWKTVGIFWGPVPYLTHIIDLRFYRTYSSLQNSSLLLCLKEIIALLKGVKIEEISLLSALNIHN
jgi:hypothetical protein